MNRFAVKMKGTKKEVVDVEVSYQEMYDAIEQVVLDSINVHPGQWIQDGNIYEDVRTSHSWTNIVRPATDRQQEVYNALGLIKHTLKVEDVL